MEAKQKIKHVGDRGRDGQRQLHNVMWRQVEHWETWQGVMTTFQSDISEEGCQRAATANQGFNTHRTLTLLKLLCFMMPDVFKCGASGGQLPF